MSHIYANIKRNVIVRLPRPTSRDSQVQKTFLAPNPDKANPQLNALHIYLYILQI